MPLLPCKAQYCKNKGSASERDLIIFQTLVLTVSFSTYSIKVDDQPPKDRLFSYCKKMKKCMFRVLREGRSSTPYQGRGLGAKK